MQWSFRKNYAFLQINVDALPRGMMRFLKSKICIDKKGNLIYIKDREHFRERGIRYVAD